jgi:N utilization substance protein B
MQRKIARENAFILIFESVCKNDETAEEIFAKATEIRGLEYDDYVKTVFFGACENRQAIDDAAQKYFTGWKKERLSPVTLALVRLAGYEIMFMEDIPGKVSINEAIELSKKYDDEKSYAFVNGVLNALCVEFLGK